MSENDTQQNIELAHVPKATEYESKRDSSNNSAEYVKVKDNSGVVNVDRRPSQIIAGEVARRTVRMNTGQRNLSTIVEQTGESTSLLHDEETGNKDKYLTSGERCVRIFFGQTPDPQPCGTGKYQLHWLMSGIFIALLKYVFAITCALIIHDTNEGFEGSASVGVNVQLLCMVVSQICIAPFTTVAVTIAGPDVIAAIFASTMADVIHQETLDHPESALPTMLFCIALTTLVCAIAWLLIGYFEGTRIVDYMPVCVVSGFLGCLAYKVLYYAVKLSVGHEWYHPESWAFWRLLLPVLPLGAGLYYMKKFHHELKMSPVLILALFLVIPAALLFAIMGGMGQTLDDLREDGWLFEAMNATDFWNVWTELKWQYIDGTAVALCLPSIFVTVVVVTIALLINLQATKQALNLPEVDAAYEMRLNGWANVVSTLFIAAPGYTQIKFNLLNAHVIENTTDKKPGLFAALFALIMMLGGFMLINYLPRILIGMMLLYAGLPLVEQNLIFSINRVTKKEFVTIWVIVLVNAVSGVWTSYSFLIAIITGVVLSSLIFAVQYSHNNVIRRVLKGHDVHTTLVRPTEQKLLQRLGIRTRIMQLDGFLFFGSTIQILRDFKKIINDNKTCPPPKRVRYVLMDFTTVKNIDHSSCLTFRDVTQIADPNHIQLVFTGLNTKVLTKMCTHGVLPPNAGTRPCFRASSYKAAKRNMHDIDSVVGDLKASLCNHLRPHSRSDVLASVRATTELKDTNLPQEGHETPKKMNVSSMGVGAVIEVPSLAHDKKKHGHHSSDVEAVVVVIDDLIAGAEFVEELILKRAAAIRKLWLRIFESFQKAHTEARVKTNMLIQSSSETFSSVCSEAVGLDLWKYATIRQLSKGQILFRQGSHHHTLYIVQSGVLTSFVTDEDDNDEHHHRHRKKAFAKTAFVNAEELAHEAHQTVAHRTVPYSVVATKKCVLWAITRCAMERMGKDDPLLAMAIVRKALRHATAHHHHHHHHQHNYQRDHDSNSSNNSVNTGGISPDSNVSLDKESVGNRNTKSESPVDLTSRLLRQRAESTISLSSGDDEVDEEWKNLDAHIPAAALQMHESDESSDEDQSEKNEKRNEKKADGIVDWATSDYHDHAFKHLHMPSPHAEKHDDGDDTLLQDLALDSDGSGNDDEKRSNDQNDNVHRTTASLVKVINQVQDSLKSDKENAKSHNHSIIKVPLILQKMQKKLRLSSRQLADARSTFMSHAAELHANDSEDTPQEQKLLLDLQELEKAIADLGVYPSHQEVEDMHRTLGHGHARDFVDLPEFLEMVKALTLADINPETRLELHRLYAKACDADRMLSRKGLADLMNILGHPEREEELDSLMLDWDAHHRGKLTFGSFLSIVAGIMKAEEIQVQIETDFKRFNPEFCQKSLSSSCPLQRAKDLLGYHITQQDLMRVHNEVGFPITSALTQEMLFDADTSGDGGVSYDELICTIELVGTDEVHEAMEAAGRKIGGAVLPTAKATRITKAPGSRD